MNSDIYIFGNLGGGYTASLKDYTRPIFEGAYNLSKGRKLVSIHRSGSELIFYTVIFPFSTNKYFGISVEFNGSYISDLDFFIQILIEEYENVVSRGQILKFDKNGIIVASDTDLLNQKNETERIQQHLRNQFINFKEIFAKLPPLSYSTSINESKELSIDVGHESIKKALEKYSNINIFFSQESALLNGYSATLKKNRKEIADLEQKVKKLERQKKRTKLVVVLMLCILIGLTFVIALKNDLNETQKRLSNKKVELCDTIKSKDAQILEQRNNYQRAKSDYEKECRLHEETKCERDLYIKKTDSLSSEISSLNSINSALQDKYDSEVRRRQNVESNLRTANNEKERLKKYEPKTKWVPANTYFYSYCGSSYDRTGCHYSNSTYVTYYYEQDGYLLTVYGWMKK